MKKLVVALIVLMTTAVGCITVERLNVGTLPSPPVSPKLRVVVLPITGEGSVSSRHFQSLHGQFVMREAGRAIRYLNETGIYTIVGADEMHAVLGDQLPTRYQLEQNNNEQAREIGRALFADYVMLMERTLEKGSFNVNPKADFRLRFVLINTQTGERYSTQNQTEAGISDEAQSRINSMIERTYREMFKKAQQDMLMTAVRKSARLGVSYAALPDQGQKTAIAPTPLPSPVQKPIETIARSGISAASPDLANAGAARLAVFDLESSDQHKTIAHILTEALREELLAQKQFVLVNRENLLQVLQEQALQQSGLIDEKQAVKTGKGLAAKQVVTGGFGLLGKTYVLQIKMTDVETQTTLKLVSARFTEGHEEDMLGQMPELARKLAAR